MKPIIFEEYNFSRAETQFPLITTTSSDAEVTETAWRYSVDIMRNDAGLLQDAFIGEYLGDLGFIEEYHQQVQVCSTCMKHCCTNYYQVLLTCNLFF